MDTKARQRPANSFEGVLADPKMLRCGFDIFGLWIPKDNGKLCVRGLFVPLFVIWKSIFSK